MAIRAAFAYCGNTAHHAPPMGSGLGMRRDALLISFAPETRTASACAPLSPVLPLLPPAPERTVERPRRGGAIIIFFALRRFVAPGSPIAMNQVADCRLAQPRKARAQTMTTHCCARRETRMSQHRGSLEFARKIYSCLIISCAPSRERMAKLQRRTKETRVIFQCPPITDAARAHTRTASLRAENEGK